MSKAILFVLGAMLMSLGVAQAGESNHREDPYNFRCRFMGSDAKKDTYGQCEAWGRVCEYSACDNHGPASLGDERRPCRNRLVISCNGQPLYDNGADHRSYGDFEFLRSENGGNFTIKYPSRHPHGDNSFVKSAWLKAYGSELTGFCAFERDPR